MKTIIKRPFLPAENYMDNLAVFNEFNNILQKADQIRKLENIKIVLKGTRYDFFQFRFGKRSIKIDQLMKGGKGVLVAVIKFS